MASDDEIGGYLELELPVGSEYHDNAIRLNAGRNAFEYILRAKHYKKVFLPYYTCDVMLEPLCKLHIDYQFYHINKDFLPEFDFSNIQANDAIVVNNYFGLCDQIISETVDQCKNLIVDNAQAFYANSLTGVDTFYSPRKFFGIPDGAYLYTDLKLENKFREDLSYKRCEHLLGRIDEGAELHYQTYKLNNRSLAGQPIRIMSKLTQRLLQSIDYQHIARRRQDNFLFLHHALMETNELRLRPENVSVPLIYPYLNKNGAFLKKKCIDNNIFTATYWPNVMEFAPKGSWEQYLTENLVSIPIDQRYHPEDLIRVLEIIKDQSSQI